jgi:nuclear migration protein JNM1
VLGRKHTYKKAQTTTARTASPSPSDEDSRHDPDAGLDRQHIDRNGARKRFERSTVDAEDVDFSDKVASSRKSYKTYESESESLSKKLARLKREAEEIKLELEKRKEGSFPNAEGPEDEGDVEDGVVKLSEMLDGLHTTSISMTTPIFKADAAHAAPSGVGSGGGGHARKKSENTPEVLQASTLTAIAAFADRLSSLESALGLASTPLASDVTSILPTLTSLATQITTLSTTLASPPIQSPSSSANTSGRSQTSSSIPHLDALASRLRNLTNESDKLAASRKRALESLHDLLEARLRNPVAFSASIPSDPIRDQAASVLEDSSAKIAALYATLPTIQDLQPMLPVVLARLRSLQVLHADAASAKGELDEVEKQQAATAQEIERWRKGLEGVEAKMAEHHKAMGKNTEIIGKMVEDVEERLARLENQ